MTALLKLWGAPQSRGRYNAEGGVYDPWGNGYAYAIFINSDLTSSEWEGDTFLFL